MAAPPPPFSRSRKATACKADRQSPGRRPSPLLDSWHIGRATSRASSSSPIPIAPCSWCPLVELSNRIDVEQDAPCEAGTLVAEKVVARIDGTNLLVEARSAWARTPGPCHTITEVRARPEVLLDDPKKELRSFTVRFSAVAGTKRGQGRGSFVGSVLALVDSFYENIVQHIKPWTPPAPSVKTRQGSEDSSDDDGITGGLPLKSVQRATSMPEWQPEAPTERVEDAAEILEYATRDVNLAGAHDGSKTAITEASHS